MKTQLTILLAAVFFLPALASADAMSDLQARFKQRYPQLAALKQAAIAGETAAGYVEFVPGQRADKDAQSLVAAENADRAQLYKLLAAREGTTPDQVAATNAKRNFDKARPGEMLKYADGTWKKKA